MTMTDVEFYKLLDAVSSAINADDELNQRRSVANAPLTDWNFEDFLATMTGTKPRAFNDNCEAWQLTPFPTGWTAFC